jgi:hypothetical protein
MKNKIPLFFFLSLAVIYLIACTIGPKDIFSVKHEVILEADTEGIFEQVNNLENWQNWNDWLIEANKEQLNFSRNVSGKGALLKFDLNIGEGELEIMQSERNRLVKTRTFFKNWEGGIYSQYLFESIGPNKTKVNLEVKNSEETAFLVRGILYLNKSKTSVQKNTLEALKLLEKQANKERAMR